MTTPICFYHRADFDGVCSAAIVKKFIPECELYGIDYADIFPWEKVQPKEDPNDPNSRVYRRQIYMVDFSLPYEQMKTLSLSSNLTWIDHHKSAISEMEGIEINGLRDSRFAGCELTWAWFNALHPSSEEEMDCIPIAVSLLGRWDVFAMQDPNWPEIEQFQLGMRSHKGSYDPLNPLWEKLFAVDDNDNKWDNVDELRKVGEGIVSYRDQENAQLCKDGAHKEIIYIQDCVPVRADGGAIHPIHLICLNTLQRGSQIFNSVWNPEKHDAMCVYGKLRGGKWRVSLYSTRENIDCGYICKMFGGGGHKGAAGFICDRLPF